MIEHQITFIANNPDSSTYLARPLRELAQKFRSQIRIINITRDRSSDATKSMAMLQVGLNNGDLCQITAFGIDAELACFVLKDLVAEFFPVIGANMNRSFSNQLEDRFPELHLSSEVNWLYAKAQTNLTKTECLKGLAHLIGPESPSELELAFNQREDKSSTCVTPGIAIPHVMFDGMRQIQLGVINSPNPIDWNSNVGHVNLAIAVVLPEKPKQQDLVTATNLTRNILNGRVSERLLATKSSIELQAILMYCMSRLLS